MQTVMYGNVNDWLNDLGQGETASTIPSSAGALAARERFIDEQNVLIDKEARRLKNAGTSVSCALTMAFMARHRPLVDARSPKVVENKLREKRVSLQMNPICCLGSWFRRDTQGVSDASSSCTVD